MNVFTKITRDRVLFVTGLAGAIYETLVEKVDRPSLLVLFAGMMGLPKFLRQDEKKKVPDDTPEPQPPQPAPPAPAGPAEREDE